jgi:uncharacterized LabA/DUF88 family protein
MKTVVYVDGYNLYYGLLRRSPYKWLDLYALFKNHVLDSSADVVEVRYYTAPVLGKMSDDPESPHRQRIYLQALKKMHPGKVVTIFGKMSHTTPHHRLVDPIPEAPHLEMVRVNFFSEKKTDVNLASDLVAGAWTGAYEQAVLCSNDSDLEGALSTVRRHHPNIRLGLVAPIPGNDHRKISRDLTQFVDWQKTLSSVHLANAQLPTKISLTAIQKPVSW